MLRRLGLNRVEVIGVLRDKMVGSIDPRAPMRVIKYTVFKEFGRIPRSSDKKTVLLSEVPDDAKLGFTSHRWFRPWHTKEECEKNGHEWAGIAHPDDSKATKHKLICDGMEKLAVSKEWDLDKVYVWIDFAGVEQDDKELLLAGVASLRGYITLCDAVLIPASGVPDEGAHTIDAVPGGYGERGWTRLEAMSMYAVSVLKQVEAPEIWVAAGDGARFLERFDYVLRELPSAGVLFSEADREYIKGHEEAFLREMKESVRRNGYITKHKGHEICVTFDPKDKNGNLVASGGDDGVVKLVIRQTGTVAWALETKQPVVSLAFNGDGSMLAAGRGDGVVQVWTVAAGSRPVEKCSLRGHSDWVRSVAFSPDSRTLASASVDKTIKLWDLSGETPVEKGTLTGHSGLVFSVAFSPDSKTLASGSLDKTVKLWDLSVDVPEEKGTLRGHTKDNPGCTCTETDRGWGRVTAGCPVRGHSGWVTCVAWNHDGSLLASSSRDETVKLWDLTTMKEKGTLRGHSGWVTCVAWNHDGSLLASSSRDETVKLWDLTTMMKKGTLRGHTGTPESSLQALAAIHTHFNIDVAEAYKFWDRDEDGVVSLEDLEKALGELNAGLSGEQIRELHEHLEHGGTCDGGGVTKDAWVEAVSAAASSEVVYDPTDSRLKCTLKGHSNTVTCVAWNHDGSLLASSSDDSTVKLWDPTTTGRRGTQRGHSGWVACVEWNHDGSVLASSSWDKTVKLWDPTTMEEKGILRGHSGPVLSVAFSPDFKTLASASSDETVKLWDLSGDAPVEKGTLKGHSSGVFCVAWNHDGSLLASAGGRGDNTVRLWDPKTQEDKGTLRGHSGDVNCVVWSPDGETVASTSEDQTVRLWTKSGELKGTLTGHSGWVFSVAFSPDSKTLASASYDKTVKLWDLSGDAPVEKGTLRGHSGWVTCVAWNHNGSLLASGSDDRTVRLWTPDGQEKGTLTGTVASWQGLDPETKELAAKVNEGRSSGGNRTGQSIVTANGDMVYIFKTNADGEKQGEPLACFRSPANVRTIDCRGTKVVLGCSDGQVLFLEAPLLAVG